MSKTNKEENPAWMQECFVKGGTRLAIFAAAGAILGAAIPVRRTLCALAGLGLGMGLAGATCVQERADYLEREKERQKPKSFFDSLLSSTKPDSNSSQPNPPPPKPKLEVKQEPKKETKHDSEDKSWWSGSNEKKKPEASKENK